LSAWRSDDDLIVVDAVVTGAPVGTVHRWDGIPPAASNPSASTHGLGVIQAFRLAHVLGCFPKLLEVYGIEGKRFEPGSPPSRKVKAAAEDLAQQIHATIQAGQTPK
jgi:hydrogenase maturation protease